MYDNSNRKKISSVLAAEIRRGHKNFIIFPYGELGRFTVRILNNKYKLKERLIIDNKLSETNPDIKKIDYLKEIDIRDSILLITSVNKESYAEVRKLAFEYMPKEQIVDIFDKKTQVAHAAAHTTSRFSMFMASNKMRLQTKIIDPRGKSAFCMSINNRKKTCVLDVGCGNNSVANIKGICDKVHYIGLDVGDYNQTQASIKSMDEYIVVSPEDFAGKIEEMRGTVDVIVSSHNIEHCNEPQRVLRAMVNALKKGGKMYLAFPSEESEFFPSRGGTLNFYDDSSHNYMPKYDHILHILQKNGMKIIYEKKMYRPFFLRKIGESNEGWSRQMNRVVAGTWAYWGFESVIWAKKLK